MSFNILIHLTITENNNVSHNNHIMYWVIVVLQPQYEKNNMNINRFS